MALRLLILSPTESRGGLEEYTLTIASAALDRGWDVHSAFLRREGTASLIRDFSTRGIKYHALEIGENKTGEKLGGVRHLMRTVRTVLLLCRVRPDVAMLNLPSIEQGLGPILGCGLLSINAVVVFHCIKGRCSFGRHYLGLCKWARSRRQRWVAVSEDNRQLLADSFQIRPQHISLIYNGVNPSRIPSPTEVKSATRKQLRHELGLNEEHQILLTVAALRPQKGHEFLIPTIPHIVSEFPGARWLWAGDGRLRERLPAFVRRYGVEEYVRFLGNRNDVADLLCAADLFVFPTRFEGNPFALLEAMAARLPLVTTDASGIPEVIEHMKHGIVCRKEDSCDLLESIRYALRHPEEMKRLANNAELRVQHFNEDRMIVQTLELLYGLGRKVTQS